MHIIKKPKKGAHFTAYVPDGGAAGMAERSWGRLGDRLAAASDKVVGVRLGKSVHLEVSDASIQDLRTDDATRANSVKVKLLKAKYGGLMGDKPGAPAKPAGKTAHEQEIERIFGLKVNVSPPNRTFAARVRRARKDRKLRVQHGHIYVTLP